MIMGYLAQVVAEIPKWVQVTANGEEIEFTTWPRFEAKTTEDLVSYFDENMKLARTALEKVTDEEMEKTFYLKNNGQVLMSCPVWDAISSSINHMVHHRGQLTVYLRLNNIAVPSIYGPSADEQTF